jgi:hypothetical protein
MLTCHRGPCLASFDPHLDLPELRHASKSSLKLPSQHLPIPQFITALITAPAPKGP